MLKRLFSVLLTLLFIAGCAAKKDLILRGAPTAKAAATEPVGLLPAVVLAELPGALAEGEDPFFAGIYVGNIVHSGGYYMADTEGEGTPARSLNYEFSAQAEYAKFARDYVDDLVGDALTAGKVDWSRLAPAAVPAPIRREVRGSHPDDGTDNVNTPRFELEPQALGGPTALGAGYGSYVVPIVVLYYSHNGGWFVGQRMGCGGGARIRLLLVSYDAASGRVIGWQDVEARTIEDMINNPNGAQLQDFLIATEEKVRRVVLRTPLP